MIRVPQRATWIASGNNLQVGGDLPRRTYWIRLDARADRLRVYGGPLPLPEELRAAIRANKAELMAAAAAADPPVPWLRILVARYRDGRAPLAMLAANLAAFVGLDPTRDATRVAAVVATALRDEGADDAPQDGPRRGA